MSIKLNNFYNNKAIEVLERLGCMTTIQYKQDLSVMPNEAQTKYYMSKMGCTSKQLVINLNGNGVTLQKGAMLWMAGQIEMTSGVKGAGDLVGKMFTGKVTGESAIKPEYKGQGVLCCEPTYKYLLLEDLANWGGAVVIDDGLFCASDATVRHTVVSRNSISAATLGGEGLFNLCLEGQGAVCLESKVPREELVEVILENDTIKIDGNFAIAWSKSLNFTVERSGKSLLGSAASGEGLVNVYRGTGRILMMPGV